MNTLVINELSKKYGKTTAVDELSFTVAKGDIFGFLGPNGAGKSTTMRAIMGFDKPTSGTVSIKGLDAWTDATAVKEFTSYVPSEPNLYPDWTGDDHIKFVGRFKPLDQAKINSLKQTLELDGSKRVGQLSTGNRQKLSIILALVQEPELLLLDEPTRGLDPLLRATFHKLLKTYQSGGGTVLISSHDLAEVEALCTDVAIIRAGKLIKDTTVASLRSAGLHQVKVTFTGRPPSFAHLKPSNLVTSGSTVTYAVRDINPVLAVIAGHDVAQIEITNASLEDAFAELYA
ncbi:ABC transporter ATP-binding protein [Candidatus Saccharibacteria bacterium]|nr:ABC transporter ATP-binding protein [Candidatus Saccharibacteria bacterium]